jgi:hydrogenase expression/formation protein HypE
MEQTPHPWPRAFRLEAVLFDFDGTLTRPDALDFNAIRDEVGCPPGTYVLEYVMSLPGGGAREAGLAALERFEARGAAVSEANEGAEEIVRLVRDLGLRVGILTRNGRRAIDAALLRFPNLRVADFDVIVTRDDAVAHKPAPDGILHAAELFGVTPARILMVGDYHLDIEAGQAAGAVTVYLDDVSRPQRVGPAVEDTHRDPDADFTVARLAQLEPIVRLGLALPQGKLPNDLLATHFAATGQLGAAADPAVLVGAGVGDDVAALDVRGAEVIVAHGDPITLSSGDLGRFAVLVNANDIATSGGEPRWLLTTVLLPVGASGAEALHLLGEIAAASAAAGLTVIGGHTEVTSAVARPVVSGTMLGTVRRADLRDKRAARAGDHLLLTKALAVEGTALLAGELADKLRELGLSDDELVACRRLIDDMSVLPEARIATGFAGVRALHDVTEGGLATAAAELAVACGRELTVQLERIAVAPETRRLCDLLGIDPLGLIGSGSLLIVCDPGESEALRRALSAAGIGVTHIGDVGEPGTAVRAGDRDRAASWPRFARDEAARVLGQRTT